MAHVNLDSNAASVSSSVGVPSLSRGEASTAEVYRIPLLGTIVTLSSQGDLRRAEGSGDLSPGFEGPVKLWQPLRWLESWLMRHVDPDGTVRLFFGVTDGPTLPQRLADRADVEAKLSDLLAELRADADAPAAVLRFMREAGKRVDPAIEMAARVQLVELIGRKWVPGYTPDANTVNDIRRVSRMIESPLQWVSAYHLVRAYSAKRRLYEQDRLSPVAYHNIHGAGTFLFNFVDAIRQSSEGGRRGGAFEAALRAGRWSPVSLMVSHGVTVKTAFRVTIRETDLGSVLSRAVPKGSLVMLQVASAAQDDAGVFNHLCCAREFLQEFSTLLVDRLYPGVRRPAPDVAPTPDNPCPYSRKVVRPYAL